MKKICLAMMFVMLAGVAAHAQSVPPLVNYQGMLTDADGKPQTGTKKLEFNLYETATGGRAVWGPQIFNGVPLVNGMFNVILGSTDTAGRYISDAFGAKDRYLGMKVDGGTELAPRQQILSTPFAINAEDANRAKNADNADLLQNKSLEEIKKYDYDSDWFDVQVGNTYKKAIGFSELPKIVTAYYKRPSGEVFLWGVNEFTHYGGGDLLWISGVLLDFDENGFLYVRTPSGNTHNRLVNLGNYRNRGNDGNESINEEGNVVQFRVFLWK